jgi:hypothetical protein
MIFWAVTLISIGLQVIPSIGKKTWDIITIDYLIYILSFVSLFYLFYFFISQKHLEKRKIILLIISGIIFTLILTIPITYCYLFVLFQNVVELTGRKFLLNFGKYYISFFETNFMFAVCGSLLKIALLWYNNTMKQKEAEKQLISGELALLRSQINPRFLLNTLTYIKSLIGTMPEKAIYSIENLSEIMSYMLYETSAEKVSLDDEINYINNYLNLQRVRYSPDYISFEVTGDTAGVQVPPLIFMPFLENAFKYGEGSRETPGIIMSLSIKENSLYFEVMNYIKEFAAEVKDEEGFSVSSIKRYLDLQFGNNYSLKINNESSKYLISLNVKLSQ